MRADLFGKPFADPAFGLGDSGLIRLGDRLHTPISSRGTLQRSKKKKRRKKKST